MGYFRPQNMSNFGIELRVEKVIVAIRLTERVVFEKSSGSWTFMGVADQKEKRKSAPSMASRVAIHRAK